MTECQKPLMTILEATTNFVLLALFEDKLHELIPDCERNKSFRTISGDSSQFITGLKTWLL